MQIFEQIGGWEMLRKINKIFYDKIYAHPWMRLYFEKIDQKHIENQQTDFMAQAMGGPQNYSGRFVPEAHSHIFITEELFALRESMLDEAFKEAGASPLLIEKWKGIDNAFKRKLLKNSVSDCVPRYSTDKIVDYPNPHTFKKVG